MGCVASRLGFRSGWTADEVESGSSPGWIRPFHPVVSVSLFFDEIPESLQVSFDSARRNTQYISRFLQKTFRFIFHRESDPGSLFIEWLKGHFSAVWGSVYTSPRDFMVRNLLKDFRLPSLFFARDPGCPEKIFCTILLDVLHAFHETRKFFKLRPLVIDRAERCVDLD